MSENGKLTNAGVLFFAKDIDFLINHAIVVCALYKGTEKVHILDKKDFKGNIVDNIDNAILFVKRHTNLEYKIEKTKREEIPDYPDVALREAIVNAVCHCDYFDKRSNIMIEVFEDRVEISNPGGLTSGLNPVDFGSKSVTRNPLIASLLHRIDYIEKMGTGINRIKQAVEEHGKSTVDFSFGHFFITTFRKLFIASDRGLESSQKSSHRILESVRQNPNITIVELAQEIGISERAVKKQIFNLKEKGLLVRVEPDKGGHWKAID